MSTNSHLASSPSGLILTALTPSPTHSPCNRFSAPFPNPDPNYYSDPSLNPNSTLKNLHSIAAPSIILHHPQPKPKLHANPLPESRLPSPSVHRKPKFHLHPSALPAINTNLIPDLTYSPILIPALILSPAPTCPQPPSNPTSALLLHLDSKHYLDLHPNLSLKP